MVFQLSYPVVKLPVARCILVANAFILGIRGAGPKVIHT